MNAAAELSRARQRLGYSLDDISHRTKIKVDRLRAIEQMDEKALPALVYVKGFLRAYAIEVELDPDDVARRYLAELPSARRTNQPSHDEPLRGGGARFPVYSVADDREDAVSLPPVQRAAPRARRPVRFPMRYAAVLIVPILALLGGWMFSQGSGTATDARLATAAESHAPAVQPQGDAAAATNAPPLDAVPATMPPSGPPAADWDRPALSERTRVEGPAPPATEGLPTAAPKNLSGSWRLTNRVRSATVGQFEDLELGFQLRLQQEGDYVFGTGYKVSENGQPLAGDGRTPIFVEGTLNGRRLHLTFTERGRRRTSGGTLLLNVADDGSLRGAFAGDAANARGSSVARKVSQ